jgi:hypothetical protein
MALPGRSVSRNAQTDDVDLPPNGEQSPLRAVPDPKSGMCCVAVLPIAPKKKKR